MIVRRILVPLDGSRLAESVLPTAASVARTFRARVVLLHVLERDAPASVHGEAHLTTAEDAGRYLEIHATRLRSEGIDVLADVHDRPVHNVAVALDEHAHELDADLIAMCAHGRTNLRDRALGTIAEQILRGGSVPIVLRTVRRPHDAAFRLHNLLVPLDFDHDVDTALDAARAFARPYNATITLLTVSEAAPAAARRFLPSASARARELDQADSEQRLDALVESLRAERFDAHSIVADDEPPAAITAAHESLPAELIIVVTDVHGGLASWYDPSTLQRLLAIPDLTLLLIREL